MTQAKITPEIHIPSKLIPVFEGTADVRGAYGGRGSAKTRTFAKMTAVQALRFAQAGVRGVIGCGRQWMNSLADSSFEEIKIAILDDDFLSQCFDIGESYIRTKCGRVSYVFVGLARNINSVKSKARILLFWIDEAEDVSDEAYQVLIPTIREELAELWVTWNPARKGSATDKRFRQTQDPLYKIVQINWRDNPRFTSKLNRERLRDLQDRPEEYGWIWEGDYRSFVSGAIWGKELAAIKAAGHVRTVPHQVGHPVYTAWDIGRRDATAVWFFQYIGGEVHVIDYVSDSFKDPDYFCSQLLGVQVTINIEYDKIVVHRGDDVGNAVHRKTYKYAALWLPHDARAKTFAAKGKSVEEQLATVFGWGLIRAVPNLSIQDGIQSARQLLKRCYFDDRTQEGFDALCAYKYEYKDNRETFADKPLHDWASNPADAFRYLAICAREKAPEPEKETRMISITQRPAMDLLQQHLRKQRQKRYD
jgi:phage terminase large subunit